MSLTLFFDLDGPLVDVAPRYVALHRDLLKAAGHRGMSADRYWERKRARIPEEEILRELGVAGTATDYLRLRLECVEAPEYLALDRPWPWTHNVFSKLASRLPLVLVTVRSSQLDLLEQLDRMELIAFFHEVLSEPARRGVDKQKARMISAYLKRNGLPAQGWLIGDTEADISAGRMVGLRTVAVQSGIRNAELLEMAAPDLLFNDIRELLPLVLEAAPVSGGVARGENS
jgi:phosphoglycolate phosphatase